MHPMAAQFQPPTPSPLIFSLRRAGVLLGALATLSLGACKIAPAPKGIETAKNFDPLKFEGTWYEIARNNVADEKGFTHVTSQYRRGVDGKWLINTRAWDGFHGAWVGSTHLSPEPSAAKPASFMLGRGNPRHVVIVDNEHTIALVCGKRYTDFWIISKSPTPDHSRLERMMMVALNTGFPVKGAFFVPTQ